MWCAFAHRLFRLRKLRSGCLERRGGAKIKKSKKEVFLKGRNGLRKKGWSLFPGSM